jgi:hypothetical protein
MAVPADVPPPCNLFSTRRPVLPIADMEKCVTQGHGFCARRPAAQSPLALAETLGRTFGRRAAHGFGRNQRPPTLEESV